LIDAYPRRDLLGRQMRMDEAQAQSLPIGQTCNAWKIHHCRLN